MIVLDAHQDIAYTALQYGRDYTRSAYATRKREAASGSTSRLATNGLPNALLGRVGIVFATLFVEPGWSPYASPDNRLLGYETPQEAYQLGIRQMDYYNRLADEHAAVDLIRNQAELTAVLDTWADGTDLTDHHVGLVLLMEGADPIVEPAQVEEWVARGVRIIGPAWSETRYAGGTGRPGPLTAMGRELLDVMADYNLILDVSHMTEEGFYEGLDRYEGLVIASHSNPTAFWDSERNLTDRQIRRLAERGGVMGVAFYNRFLNEQWYAGSPKANTPFTVLIDVVDHICQVTGSAAHVGIGTDIDGGFGAEDIPEGIDTVTDLLTIADGLRNRGYAEVDIEGVMSGNFLRVLRQALG